MLEDTLLSTANRTQTKLQSLEDMFEQKLKTVERGAEPVALRINQEAGSEDRQDRRGEGRQRPQAAPRGARERHDGMETNTHDLWLRGQLEPRGDSDAQPTRPAGHGERQGIMLGPLGAAQVRPDLQGPSEGWQFGPGGVGSAQEAGGGRRVQRPQMGNRGALPGGRKAKTQGEGHGTKDTRRKILEAWPSLDVDNGGTLWHTAKQVAR